MRIVSFRAGSLIPHKCALLFWSLVAAFGPSVSVPGHLGFTVSSDVYLTRTPMTPAKDSKYKHSARSVQSLLFCPPVLLSLPLVSFLLCFLLGMCSSPSSYSFICFYCLIVISQLMLNT